MTTYTEALRRYIAASGRSQFQVAELADCDHSYISRILNGTRMPSPDMIDRIGTAVGMPDREILHWIIVTAIPERFHDALLHRERVVPLDALMTKLEQVGIGGRAA